jgi:hypothetical protein
MTFSGWMGMMVPVRTFSFGILVLVAAVPALAQDGPGPHGLAAVQDLDPLEIELRVRRSGDDAVLALLREEAHASFEQRLTVIEGARWLRAPECALEPLARIAAGRDSILAPRASAVALDMVRELSADQLTRRDVLWFEIQPARDRFALIAEDSSARPDLRLVAAMVVDALEAFRDRPVGGQDR